MKTIVWDSCRAHISKAVKDKLSKRGVRSIIIPGGLTSFLQAVDLDTIIKDWKNSGCVELVGVRGWVKTFWKSNCFNSSGFSDDHKPSMIYTESSSLKSGVNLYMDIVKSQFIPNDDFQEDDPQVLILGILYLV
jgi:hypothetical protein